MFCLGFFPPQKKTKAFASNKENQFMGKRIIENRKKVILILFHYVDEKIAL